MARKLFIAPLAALAFLATPALAEPAPAAPATQEARIPFADNGGIRDWRSEGNRTIYVQDRFRKWYKAELFHPVSGLPFAWSIGFDTSPMGTFDRFSYVVVDHQRVPVASLVRVDGPPAKPVKARSKA